MFSEKKDKPNNEPGTAQNRINEGTKLKGDINSSGFFRIDGTVDGNITTPSKVVIGKTGVVLGILTCENADIEGKFDGNLKVSGTLTLKSSAQLNGDVITGKLVVEPGATFNATCIMNGGTVSKQVLVKDIHDPNIGKIIETPFERDIRLKNTASNISQNSN